MSKTPDNPLGMSDEDFLQQNAPAVGKETPAVVEAEAETVVDEPEPKTEAELAADAVEEEVEEPAAENEGVTETVTPEDKPGEEADESKVDDDAAASAAADKETETEGASEAPVKAEVSEADAVAAYKEIMAPFKANGKTIELRNIEEAKQLMQMGANYTRKMQDLAPHRKILTMLQNNDLLDESKLSYLIDLDKKNPDAVKKLIKDSGVDPLDVDTEGSEYVGGNHTVSAEEVEFRSTLEELSSDDAGKETLSIISKQWDEPSKEILWSKPEVMTAIHQQRELGLYTKIADEVARRITLGQIDPKIPFLQAYTETGDEMAKAALEASGQTAQEEQSGKPELKLVATRTATPKSGLKDGDNAGAASLTRATPATAKAFVNPLAMSDDEFLKQMNNRV